MEKKQSLAWPCPPPRDPVLHTHPADQSVANPPQKGRRAIINSIHMTYSLVGLNRVKLAFDRI